MQDPFEIRMAFLECLKKLNASQQSISKVVSFAIHNFPRCGDDLWDCIVEECQKGSMNHRINILYFLDSLCEMCLLAKSNAGSLDRANPKHSSYVNFMARDLGTIVESVVPEGREGFPNLISTKQILENWRSKRVLDAQKIEDAMSILTSRSLPNSLSRPPSPYAAAIPAPSSTSRPPKPMSKNDIFKRIEEDRERHKRLRERRWVQPIVHNSAAPYPLTSFLPLGSREAVAEADDSMNEGRPPVRELPIDVEFENEWETTSDWNEDDDEAALEEVELCFPLEGEGDMDLS